MSRISQSEQRVSAWPGGKALAEPNRSSRRLPLGNDAEDRIRRRMGYLDIPMSDSSCGDIRSSRTRMRACWRIVDLLRGMVRTSCSTSPVSRSRQSGHLGFESKIKRYSTLGYSSNGKASTWPM